MKRRRYSDEERSNAVAAVLANGGNVEGTAKRLGVPPKTLEHWIKQHHHPEAAKDGGQKKGSLADELEKVAWACVGAMPAKITTAPLSQVAVTLGISVEKMRLLRDQSTATLSHTLTPFDGVTDADLDRELADLDARITAVEGTAGRAPAGEAPAAGPG